MGTDDIQLKLQKIIFFNLLFLFSHLLNFLSRELKCGPCEEALF